MRLISLSQWSARAVTLSDSSGYIYDGAGINREKLAFIMDLKSNRRGRMTNTRQNLSKRPTRRPIHALDHNPLWDHKAECAFPSATQNEINGKDAANLLKNGVYVVSEGANMPTTIDGVNQFLRDEGYSSVRVKPPMRAGSLPRCPEMAQNSMRISWTARNRRGSGIMKTIHEVCYRTAGSMALPVTM